MNKGTFITGMVTGLVVSTSANMFLLKNTNEIQRRNYMRKGKNLYKDMKNNFDM